MKKKNEAITRGSCLLRLHRISLKFVQICNNNFSVFVVWSAFLEKCTSEVLYSGTFPKCFVKLKIQLLLVFWTLLLIAQESFSQGILTVKCKDFMVVSLNFYFRYDWQGIGNCWLLNSICYHRRISFYLYELFIKTHQVYSVDLIYYYHHHHFKKISNSFLTQLSVRSRQFFLVCWTEVKWENNGEGAKRKKAERVLVILFIFFFG